MGRQTRALAVAGLAIVCGGAAASIVSGKEARVRAQVGPLVPVVVAAQEIPKGKLITAAGVGSILEQRSVPARFAPPNVLRRPGDALGFRAAASLTAGDYVTAGQMAAPGRDRGGAGNSAPGRLIEVLVSGASAVLTQLEPGTRVDVLITSDRGGSERTFLALQQVQLVTASPSANGSTTGSSERPADAVATLRVSLREAILLTAAQNFAREIRLVPRPEGDRRYAAPLAVTSENLRQ